MILKMVFFRKNAWASFLVVFYGVEYSFFQNYSMWHFFENLNASSGQKGCGHLVRCSYNILS